MTTVAKLTLTLTQREALRRYTKRIDELADKALAFRTVALSLQARAAEYHLAACGVREELRLLEVQIESMIRNAAAMARGEVQHAAFPGER